MDLDASQFRDDQGLLDKTTLQRIQVGLTIEYLTPILFFLPKSCKRVFPFDEDLISKGNGTNFVGFRNTT